MAEQKRCWQARCQTCGQNFGIYDNHESANADARSHTTEYPDHKVNLYKAPCE
jgi:hypothetical protein